jgi:XTP/dITP diphosphohydrolase
MKLKFITTNKHKVEEIGAILKEYGVELEQAIIDYPENKEASIEEVAREAAKNLAEELGEPVMVEDTGFYFDAYDNFPGSQPKFVIKSIGFDGIFRLLAGKDRGFTARTAIGYCEPEKEPQIFIGEMHGQVIDHIVNPDADTMPYNHIIIPDGYNKTVAEMNIAEKNQVLQRGKAARKLGEYLMNKKT